MKKYWKLFTLVTLIVLVIGGFYLNANLVKTTYPKFVIKHKSGDQKEIENISIAANLEIEGQSIFTEIDTHGNSYPLPISYLDIIKGLNQSTFITQLQKDYHSFMRGKSDVESQYYQDKNVLAYVEMKSDYQFAEGQTENYFFEVSTLDKTSNKTKTFKVKIPASDGFNYIHVVRVQVMDGQIKVITLNDTDKWVQEMPVYRDELHLYNINIKDEEIVRDDLIFDDKEINPEYTISTSLIENSDQTKLNNLFVYSIDVIEEQIWNGEDEESTSGEYQEPKLIMQKRMIYNLKTNEQQEIMLPEEYGEDVYPQLLNDKILYYSEDLADRINLIGYNLQTNEIENEQAYKIVPEDETGMLSYSFENGKLYLMNQSQFDKSDTDITIINIDTEEIIYEGFVKIKKESMKDYKINMEYLQIR